MRRLCIVVFPRFQSLDVTGPLEVFAMADRLAAAEKVEQERYDAETNHGRNAAKQHAWTATIQTRLQHAGIHY